MRGQGSIWFEVSPWLKMLGFPTFLGYYRQTTTSDLGEKTKVGSQVCGSYNESIFLPKNANIILDCITMTNQFQLCLLMLILLKRCVELSI